jgi:hypothetical protein
MQDIQQEIKMKAYVAQQKQQKKNSMKRANPSCESPESKKVLQIPSNS